MASAQLPQATRSQAGKPEEFELRPQSHMVSLSGNLSIVQARTIPMGGLISPLFSPAFDRAFDHL